MFGRAKPTDEYKSFVATMLAGPAGLAPVDAELSRRELRALSVLRGEQLFMNRYRPVAKRDEQARTAVTECLASYYIWSRRAHGEALLDEAAYTRHREVLRPSEQIAAFTLLRAQRALGSAFVQALQDEAVPDTKFKFKGWIPWSARAFWPLIDQAVAAQSRGLDPSRGVTWRTAVFTAVGIIADLLGAAPGGSPPPDVKPGWARRAASALAIILFVQLGQRQRSEADVRSVNAEVAMLMPRYEGLRGLVELTNASLPEADSSSESFFLPSETILELPFRLLRGESPDFLAASAAAEENGYSGAAIAPLLGAGGPILNLESSLRHYTSWNTTFLHLHQKYREAASEQVVLALDRLTGCG